MSDPFLSFSMLGDSGAADELAAFDAIEQLRVWGAQWGPKVTEALQNAIPSGPDGPLGESIQFAISDAGGGISIQWTTDKFYARYLIEGTEAHGPDTASILHWVSGGGDVWAHWVSGIAPDTWPIYKAVGDLLPAMTDSLVELFEEW